MKSEEKDYLIFKKTNEGKDLERAELEIKMLIESQKGFKQLKREVQILERRLAEKDKQIDKLRKSNFSLLPRGEKKVKEIKESNNKEITLKEINRIMSILDSEKRIGLSELEKVCIVKPDKLKGLLNFLLRYNLIKQYPEGNGRYSKLIIEKIDIKDK